MWGSPSGLQPGFCPAQSLAAWKGGCRAEALPHPNRKPGLSGMNCSHILELNFDVRNAKRIFSQAY
jgi:hypothetical protein